MDGVYAENYISPAFRKADVIIVLKPTRLKLIYRILKREISQRKKYQDKPLSDLLKLLYWSQRYKNHNEKKHLPLAEKYRKKVIFLRNNHEKDSFLKSIKIS